jgi:uncharacterized membrane protein YdbT with pleckstrin-like domain
MTDAYLNRLLADRESIILVTRQHWIVLLQAIGPEIILAAGITLMVVLALTILFPLNLLFLWGFILLILPLGSMVRDIMKWYSHMYVVTTRRVIQVFGVINKNVTDSSLEKVNDVKMDQSFLGRILDYGDVEILTASELGINRFTMIGDPVNFKTAMMNAKIKLGNDEIVHVSQPKQVDVAGLLSQLGTLRQQGIITEEEFQKKKAELLAKL